MGPILTHLAFYLIALIGLAAVLIAGTSFCLMRAFPTPSEMKYPRLTRTFAVLLFAAALPVSYWVLLEILDFRPLRAQPNVLAAGGRSEADTRISEIRHTSASLQEAISRLEDLSIKEIRTTIQQLLDFLATLEREALDRQRYLEALQERIVADRKEAAKAKQDKATAHDLTGAEIELLSRVLTSDAARQSQFWFIVGAVVSFPIGIVTSIVSSLMLRRLGFPS